MGRKSNAPQRREEITWALYECLATKGHEKVTTKEIAAQAKLPPGVIHYYFKSKDEIVSTLAQAIVNKYSHQLELCLSDGSSESQRLDSAINFIVDKLIFNPPLNRVFYNLIQMSFERTELRGVMKHMLQDYRKRLAQFFSEAGISGSGYSLGAALVALSEGFSLQLMVEPEAISRTDVHRLILQTLQECTREK